jgi:hypothetical protein
MDAGFLNLVFHDHPTLLDTQLTWGSIAPTLEARKFLRNPPIFTKCGL